MISYEKIKQLKQIISEELGKDLDIEEVADIAQGLVGYYDLLGKIDYARKTKNLIKIEINVTINLTIKCVNN